MSLPITAEKTRQNSEVNNWECPEPPTDLIFDDGEPMETNRHRIAMNILINSLEQHWSDRNDFFVGGNMFIYYSSAQVKNKDFKGPDFFVVLNVDPDRSRQGWVVWEENGRYPDVIIELMSASTAKIDLGQKKKLYEQTFRTKDYFVYSPFNPNSLQGWTLDPNLVYQPLIANDQGWLWSQTLGLWLGTWSGKIQRDTAFWLRFYDQEKNLVLLPDEAAKQEAETEKQRAETEKQRAETEKQRAETEKQRAETEKQRAETEKQRAERLAAKLRELGEDPNLI